MSITKDHRKGDEMDVTEELCRLLDEQGLEWREHEAPAAECIAFFDGNGWHDCWESVDGEVNVTFSMTPEQAIAATLGRGTCKPMTYDNGYPMDRVEPGEYYEFWEPACACSECGELIPMRRYCPNCGRRIVDPTTNDVDAGATNG